MHYLGVAIVLFNMDLYDSAFSSYLSKKLVFHVSAFCVFFLFFFDFAVTYINIL